MNEVIRLIQNHRSIRKYTEEPISQEQVQSIIRSAQAAASSSNVQAYTVIGVTAPEKKQQLARLTGNQRWVEEAPLFLVWCADLHRLQTVCVREGSEMIHEPIENFIVATVDVALAAQNALLAAESMGLGGVFIGGIRNQPHEVVKLLEIPELVYPVFGMCIGHPAQHPDIRPRLPWQAVYHENRYDGSKVQESVDMYDAQMTAYYDKRTGGTRTTTWSKEMATKYAQPFRSHMREFLLQQGFKLE